MFVLFVLLMSIITLDSTDLQSSYSEDYDLTSLNSPFYINHDVFFNGYSSTVTIENGVEIIFTGNYNLLFYGSVIIGCNEMNNYMFDTNQRGLINTTSFVYIHKNNSSSLQQGVISFWNQYRSISNISTNVNICNTKFENLSKAIRYHDVDLIVDHSEFNYNEYAMYADNLAFYYKLEHFTVQNSVMSHNEYIDNGEGSALYNNIDFNNYRFFYVQHLSIKNSRITRNTQDISADARCISVQGEYNQILENTIISNCGIGIHSVGKIDILNNIFTNIHGTGIRIISGHDNIVILNNIFINNTFDHSIDSSHWDRDNNLIIANNKFIDNYSRSNLIKLYVTYGVSVYVSTSSDIVIENNSFTHNINTYNYEENGISYRYRWWENHLIVCFGNNITVTNNIFVDNVIPHGNIMYIEHTRNMLQYTQNLFLNNILQGGDPLIVLAGGAMFVEYNEFNNGFIYVDNFKTNNVTIQYNSFYGSSYVEIGGPNINDNCIINYNNFYDHTLKQWFIKLTHSGQQLILDARYNYYDSLIDIDVISLKMDDKCSTSCYFSWCQEIVMFIPFYDEPIDFNEPLNLPVECDLDISYDNCSYIGNVIGCITHNPTDNPSYNPNLNPTSNPTSNPTNNPSYNPTSNPTIPTLNPTTYPTSNPITAAPTFDPITTTTVYHISPPSSKTTNNPTTEVEQTKFDTTEYLNSANVLTLTITAFVALTHLFF